MHSFSVYLEARAFLSAAETDKLYDAFDADEAEVLTSFGVGSPTFKQARAVIRVDAISSGDALAKFRFAEAGFLNDRSNIVVLVDEAHRTQEGTLGDDMRAAVPNAQFFGLTGHADLRR